MSTGAEHYRKAETLLAKAELIEDGRPTQRMLLASGLVHATLAHAAATALFATTDPDLRDTPAVSDWYATVRLTTEVQAGVYPAQWPPTSGDVWQDRDGWRWVCLGTGYLANLGRTGDDSAEEIWRTYGPLRWIMKIRPQDGGC